MPPTHKELAAAAAASVTARQKKGRGGGGGGAIQLQWRQQTGCEPLKLSLGTLGIEAGREGKQALYFASRRYSNASKSPPKTRARGAPGAAGGTRPTSPTYSESSYHVPHSKRVVTHAEDGNRALRRDRKPRLSSGTTSRL